MAAAIFNRLAPAWHHAESAGTNPYDGVLDTVVTVMLELGIDLSEGTPRLLTEELAESCDLLVTMGCGETCPVVPGLERIDWKLADPSVMERDGVRALRDQIERRVRQLLKSLEAQDRTQDNDVGKVLS